MGKNAAIDSTLLDKAIIFATNAHKNTERRGKGFPYIIHPLEVACIVSTMTSSQELLAAAVLHDTVEDTDTSIETIRNEFGDNVAKIVESESDKVYENMSETDSWKMRKEFAISRLAKANLECKIVALGDKLSNMRAIYRDYLAIGNKVWEKFHIKDPKEHEWHYRGLANSLIDLKDTLAYKEFAELIEKVFNK